MGVVTTVFRVVIASVVVAVVLDAYWPHRPGPKYTNPGKKKSQSTQSLVSRYITYVPPYEYQEKRKLETKL
jgi:hypothetical protein